MNKTLEDVYEKYINKKIPEFNLYNDLNEIKAKENYINKEIPEFNLYNDLKEIKEKENEGNDYIDRYQKIALKLIATYKKGEIIKNN